MCTRRTQRCTGTLSAHSGGAKERFTVHLRPEDVQAELDPAPDLEALTNALARLVEWGNLRADPDTGRVTTVEDFHRARYLYQLSVEGEAAEQALAVYERAMSRRAVLQSLGDALASRVPGEDHVTTSSSDGTMLVRLSVLPDAPTVEIHTVDGVLRGPDHLIEIVDLTTVEVTIGAR
jgi:hypothetical protein